MQERKIIKIRKELGQKKKRKKRKKRKQKQKKNPSNKPLSRSCLFNDWSSTTDEGDSNNNETSATQPLVKDGRVQTDQIKFL